MDPVLGDIMHVPPSGRNVPSIGGGTPIHVPPSVVARHEGSRPLPCPAPDPIRRRTP